MKKDVFNGSMESEQCPASAQPLLRFQARDYSDKIVGCILGFAIGDALGTPQESPLCSSEIRGDESAFRKRLKLGQYIGNTQHLKIGLEALLESSGEIHFEAYQQKLVEEYACETFTLPRLIPYSLLSAVSRYPYKLERRDLRKIMGTTHAPRTVVQMGELFHYFTQEIMQGRSLQGTMEMILFEDNFLNKRIRQKLGTVRDLAGSSLSSSAALQSLETSAFIEAIVFSTLYANLKGNLFGEAVLIAANGGGDSNSRAALTGALYGLEIGATQIPSPLKENLESRDELEKKAKKIYFLRR